MLQTGHAPRTLFIDDESINLEIASEILSAFGASVETAENGLEQIRAQSIGGGTAKGE